MRISVLKMIRDEDIFFSVDFMRSNSEDALHSNTNLMSKKSKEYCNR